MNKTGNFKQNNVIKKFDEQIKSELTYNDNDKYKCPSYWNKLLFIETENFNIFDWKIIQTDEYLNKKRYYEIAKKNSTEFYKAQEELVKQLKFMYETALSHNDKIVIVNNERFYITE